MILLFPFGSRENLLEVTQLAIQESGLEHGVGALSSYVIYALYKTITAKQVKFSGIK